MWMILVDLCITAAMEVVPRRPGMDCGCFSVSWRRRELPPLELPEPDQVAADAPNTSKYESSYYQERSQDIYRANTQSSISTNSHSSSVQPSFCSSLNSENHLVQSSPYASFSFENTTFMYEELVHATNDFSSENLIGRGGFGNVYIGKLKDGREVAIKQLKDGSSQGEREFQAEVETITRVHHRCLVSLVGYCLSTTRRLLVYEYVTNGSLEFHLHGKGKSLDWATRMKIALGSAKGLKYLHEDCHPKIIHRDIKSANILLDKNFDAKVADFGLARFQLDANTHVSTRVVGTFGYLAPEYALTGKITDKSDVFSFGVLLLELITGRWPIGKSQGSLDDNIIDWARPLLLQTLESKNFDQVADPRLEKNYNSLEMARMAACASACVQHLARNRPRMRQVVHALQGMLPLDDLKRGTQDMQTTKSHGFSDVEASLGTLYRDDLKRIMNMSLENNTSECSTSPISDFSTQTQLSSSVPYSLPTTRSMGL